jgi:2-alkenal reductase
MGPSVVNIISSTVAREYFSRAQPRPTGAGSGFILDEQGHIATNNHVAEDAGKLEVTLADGGTVPAKLVGRDARSDLAVVKVDVAKERLKVARLGSSGQVQIGETAIAIGNPFGLERTVTAGIVSGRRPAVEEPNGGPQSTADAGVLIDAIQTDASINPGNSGGPLFNARGEVIGINTLIVSPGAGSGMGGNIGIGFAQPIDYVKRVIPELIAKQKYGHPFLGVSTQRITESIAEELKLPVKEGLLVAQVDAGTPAAAAGVKGGTRTSTARATQISVGGDIITRIDEKPVRQPEELVLYLEMNKRPNEQVSLTVLRDGREMQIRVTLGERPIRS